MTIGPAGAWGAGGLDQGGELGVGEDLEAMGQGVRAAGDSVGGGGQGGEGEGGASCGAREGGAIEGG